VPNAGWLEVRCTRGYCEVQTTSGEVMELFGAVTTGLPFQVDVYVYNDRNGHMIITKVGP
jgi:rare lipoprotein A (peptidoglycan hydrolase)